MAAATAQRGHRIDRQLVETAALLHDLDKALPEDERRQAMGHGHAGADWLVGLGYGELGPVVADHPVTRLADEPTWRRWWNDASIEARVVSYADKRVTSELVPMAARFADWRRRYPEVPERTALAEERAQLLEQDVCMAGGLRPEDVERLAWAAEAIERVRQAR
ncbi:MAG TPA: HD domain-containing protein [Candidatus Limnocylindrales bacterium]|nr:HD domain-containing protein [Candidatus Limnocylindrales bacterium]